MSVKVTWHGHATWMIETDEHKILLDPFFADNPAAVVSADDVSPDAILVSHGHFDHISDAASIAKRTGAPVVAIFEIAQWLSEKQGVENTTGMNIGGRTQIPGGSVKMVPAVHSSGLPDGSYGGEPAGFVVAVEDKQIYFACDTALFSDMKLIGDLGIDLAVLPIGDLFTMDPDDSVQAAQILGAPQVLPTHYNTWPPIEQDAAAWAKKIKSQTKSKPVVLKPGDTHTL